MLARHGGEKILKRWRLEGLVKDLLPQDTKDVWHEWTKDMGTPKCQNFEDSDFETVGQTFFAGTSLKEFQVLKRIPIKLGKLLVPGKLSRSLRLGGVVKTI